MADQTVADGADVYGYADVRTALQQTSQGIAIMRAVSLAVAAQEDGSVRYEDNEFSRWEPAVGAVCARVHAVRDALQNKEKAPDTIDWWTPLTILEATGAALWHAAGIRSRVDAMSSDELQSIARAAIDALGKMFEELTGVADKLSGSAS